MRWSRVWVVAPLVGGLALACGSDVVEDDLIGTWNATEFVFSNFEDPVTDFDVIAMGGDLSVVIRADGTYTLTLSQPLAEPEVIEGDWVLNGDVLTLDEGVDAVAFEISLNGDTLTLHSEDVEFDFDDDGTDDPAQVDVTLVRV
jgi:hypothetical protein